MNVTEYYVAGNGVHDVTDDGLSSKVCMLAQVNRFLSMHFIDTFDNHLQTIWNRVYPGYPMSEEIFTETVVQGMYFSGAMQANKETLALLMKDLEGAGYGDLADEFEKVLAGNV